VVLGGSAVTSVKIYDNASAGSGTIIALAGAPIGGTGVVDLTPLGGSEALAGLYATLAGTDGMCIIFYD
jgi:hypothetical protein